MNKMTEELDVMMDTLCGELGRANDKIRKAGGVINLSDLEFIDKLTHSLKSVLTASAMSGHDSYGSYGGSYGAMYRDDSMRYNRRGYDSQHYDEGTDARRGTTRM